MNERIKELAEQAGADFMRRINYNNLEGKEYEEDAGVIFDSNESFEKFAELIVKECLQQCEQVRDDAYTQKKSEFLTESGRLIYEGVFGGATNCGFAIQQHFGVEE
jgi:hypothetical protein